MRHNLKTRSELQPQRQEDINFNFTFSPEHPISNSEMLILLTIFTHMHQLNVLPALQINVPDDGQIITKTRCANKHRNANKCTVLILCMINTIRQRTSQNCCVKKNSHSTSCTVSLTVYDQEYDLSFDIAHKYTKLYTFRNYHTERIIYHNMIDSLVL